MTLRRIRQPGSRELELARDLSPVGCEAALLARPSCPNVRRACLRVSLRAGTLGRPVLH